MEQSGTGILVGRNVKTGDNSGVVILIAGRVDGEVKAVFGPAAGLAFGAEAVICISNKKLTWQVVHGLERRGIPAFGAIWDS